MLWGSGERAWSLLGFDLGGSGCAVGGLRCGVVLAGGRGLGLWWGFKMRLRRRVGNRRPFARAASPLARRRFPTQRLHAPVLSVLAARLARRGMLTRCVVTLLAPQHNQPSKVYYGQWMGSPEMMTPIELKLG